MKPYNPTPGDISVRKWPASSGAESPVYFLALQVGCLYQTGQVSIFNVAGVDEKLRQRIKGFLQG